MTIPLLLDTCHFSVTNIFKMQKNWFVKSWTFFTSTFQNEPFVHVQKTI